MQHKIWRVDLHCFHVSEVVQALQSQLNLEGRFVFLIAVELVFVLFSAVLFPLSGGFLPHQILLVFKWCG
jgi:hypothetical protein